MRFSFARITCHLLILAPAACGGGTTTVEPPPPPPTNFSVALKPLAEDLAAAQALGWANGIPDAVVTLTPNDSSGAPRTVRTSASGTADFGTVASGTYIVEAIRWLSPAEVAGLPVGEDVDGWVLKRLVTATGQGGGQQLGIPASRRKGLVISEWAFNIAALPEVGATYPYGGYVEIYNNGDTTAYLDRLTIVQAFAHSFDFPNFPCGTYGQQLGLDPSGIWTRHIQQFPGAGHEHPLLPGTRAVVAVDAINHANIAAKGIDLSHADFEFWGGPGDVDNPAVPNMIDTLSIGHDITGHGPIFQNSASVAVLARPYNKGSASRLLAIDGNEWALVPGNFVLDVVSLWPNFVYIYPRCSRVVNAVFDRASSDVRGHDQDIEYEYSISRRPVPIGLSDHLLLQNSRDSNADFVRTRRSPGAVP
jgi:hypothetical protein